jgi:lauroyl/myristoyl acyltransferase
MMTKGDLFQAGRITALAAIAWSTPPRLWRRIAAAIPNFRSTDPALRRYQRTLGLPDDANAVALLDRRRRAHALEAKLQILGLIGPWRSWRPDVRLRGESHLQMALANGRGAILWVAESYHGMLMLKIALHRAGYRLCQLSRPTHGFSISPFGIRYLNPLWRRVEDRFINERVLIPDDDAAPAMEALRARLTANGVVFITLGPEARRFVEVPFLHHRIRVPTGPIRLAQDTGAALLPAFTFADDDGSFEASVEPAIASPHGRGTFDVVAAAYAERITPFVRAYPEQWTGWEGYRTYLSLLDT